MEDPYTVVASSFIAGAFGYYIGSAFGTVRGEADGTVAVWRLEGLEAWTTDEVINRADKVGDEIMARLAERQRRKAD